MKLLSSTRMWFHGLLVVFYAAATATRCIAVDGTRNNTIISASFTNTSEGFYYFDNTFRKTRQPNYSSGRINNGPTVIGVIQINLGGIDNETITDMSGGFRRDFSLTQDGIIEVFVNYRIATTSPITTDEFTQVLCSIDGVLVGRNSSVDYLAQIYGNLEQPSQGFLWGKTRKQFVKAGHHRFIVGAYRSKKTASSLNQIFINQLTMIFNATIATPMRAPILPPIVSNNFVVRVNAGANADYRDPNGNLWIADTYHGGKGRTNYECPMSINGTELDEIYCTDRFFDPRSSPAPFRYDIPVPRAGTYTVRLHFAETFYNGAGHRIFEVWVNGVEIVSSLDIGRRVGYRYALVVPIQTRVTQRTVSIEFVPIIEFPKINGIEVLEISNNPTAPGRVPARVPQQVPVPAKVPTQAPVPAKVPTKAPVAPVKVPTVSPTRPPVPISPPLPVPSAPVRPPFHLRINAGSDIDFVTSNSVRWRADTTFRKNGGIFSTCPTAIANTTLDEIYCKERYFNKWEHPLPFRYTIPVPRVGVYAVYMHFAELVYKAPEQRVFDIWVNGKQEVSALDIFKEVGHATALIIPVIAKLTGRSFTIEFVPRVENPKISGIEVVEIDDYVDPPTTAPVTAPFNLLINSGGESFLDSSGSRRWVADQYFIGGLTYADNTNPINGTMDDILYHTERNGEFKYEIPVPVGSYEVVFHFAELYWREKGKRLFNIKVENVVTFANVDLVALGGGNRLHAFTLTTPVTIEDGFVSIEFTDASPRVDMPKLSGIEINFLQPHLAHSVANGPYVATDLFNRGSATITMDGTFSHSHGTGLDVVQWTWREGSTVIGVGPTPNITFPVGDHTVTLFIRDNHGNEASDTTSVTINPFGYPAVLSIEPRRGSIAGGQFVTIRGSGFTYGPEATKVKFGIVEISGSAITIVDQFTIRLRTPTTVIGSPVAVSVQTPLASSNAVTYTYEASVPIAFQSGVLTDVISHPTRVAFGPDGKLYVGTLYGQLARLTLDETFTKVTSSVISEIAKYRGVLGIAFDPLQNTGLPDVYVTTSFFFHGDPTSSSGQAINAKVKKVSGANLDVIVDIVTGLPVSDHDHGVTGLLFGDNGEIYIQCASNTNGGIPGRLTGKQVQKDNYFSSSTVVAHLASPTFDGEIKYSAPDDGVPLIAGKGIEVFAAGTRNPWGICLHSNGNIYATDNGPNYSYGDFMTGCEGQFKPDFTEGDKINLLRKGKYYGTPNRIRALTDKDPRQCIWRSQFEPTDSNYTAPILITKSSTDGLVEFSGDHFDRQLRGNLIAAKYQGSLYRVVLTPDGEGVIPQSNPYIELTEDVDALDVAQAPDGTLISNSLDRNAIYFHKPVEQPATTLKVLSVFPRRGGLGGGNRLQIYGVNFTPTTRVTVGRRNCPVVSFLATKIECTLPGGSGTVDIVVQGNDNQRYVFARGYRYVSGLPIP